MKDQVVPDKVKNEEPLTILQKFRKPSVRTVINKALSAKINIDEFISNVILEIKNNPTLGKCTYDSLLQCTLDSANFGLTPNNKLGLVWFIPYKNKDNGYRYEANLQIGYKGYIKKLSENGITLEVETVTYKEIEEGKFKEERGSSPSIFHHPGRTGLRDKKTIALTYAIARKAGMADIVAVMSKEEIEEAAKTRRKNKRTDKWERSLGDVWLSERLTDYGEMCKKTLAIRVSKLCNVDIALKMAAYEYKVNEEMKDITPQTKTPRSLSDIFGNPEEAPPNTETSNGPAEERADKIIAEINGAKTKDDIEKVLLDNVTHTKVMKKELTSKIYDTCRIKTISLLKPTQSKENALLEPKNNIKQEAA